MKNKDFQRVLSLMCAVVMLLTMAPVSGKAVTSDKLTFSDFGMDDMTHSVDAYTGSLTDGQSLDGKTFEGYFRMGLCETSYHSVRIGTTALASGGLAWNGIGIRANNTTEWEIGNYNVAGGNGGGYVSLTGRLKISDYGITYDAATNMFSEVKLTMSWDYVEGTKDIVVVMKLNDKVCFNGKVANLQNNIGTNIFLWSYQQTPISIRSVADKPVAGNVHNVSFADLGFEDGTKNPSYQKGGTFPNIATGADLNAVAFNGNVALGLPATGSQPMRYQSVRIGGSTVTNGIGFTPVSNGLIYLYHYSAENKGVVLKEIKASDYGIAYDNTNGYGAFDFRITYQNIPDTTNTWVTVTVNDKACYEGVIANGQHILGNRAWVFAYTSPITITSKIVEEEKPVSFLNFGMNDGIVPMGSQHSGELTGATLDGMYFAGYLQMKFPADTANQSFRIGVKHTAGRQGWNGIGLVAVSPTELKLINYTDFRNGKELAKINPSAYGITYREGEGFDEFLLSVQFSNKGESDVVVTVRINGILAYFGVIANGQNTLSTGIRFNAQDAPIYYRSVTESFRDVTFADFARVDGTDKILDQTFAANQQYSGRYLKSATTMDGIAFTGILQLHVPTTGNAITNRQYSVRIGANNSNAAGIGLYVNSSSEMVLFRYTALQEGNALVSFNPADYGINYSEADGFDPFKLRITFRYVGENDVHVTASINEKEIYNNVVAGLQNNMGTAIWLYARSKPITVKSYRSNEYFGDADKFAENFDAYYASADGFAAGNAEDYWTLADGVLTRKKDANVAMLLFKNQTYKNFELTMRYYVPAGATEVLTLGVGASEPGKYFTEESGHFGLVITGGASDENRITLDSSAFLTEGWHTVTIQISGRMMKAYVGGSSDVIAAALPVSYNGGYIYLAAAGNGVQIKNLTVTALSNNIINIGDANADGDVNVADLVRLKKALNNIDNVTVNAIYVDFDNDNRVTSDDMSALRQYLLHGSVKKTLTNGYIWGQDVMPIGGYYGPKAGQLTDAYFQAVASSGINLINTTDINYYTNPTEFMTALELAAKYKVYFFGTDGLSRGATESEIRTRLQEYNSNPYFAGVRVVDEPSSDTYQPDGFTGRHMSNYARVASLTNRISGMTGYVNLFPYYRTIKNVTWEGYEQYVREYCESVFPAKSISFDHYVFDGQTYEDYFKNMSIIRNAAQEYGMDFWAFVCAGRGVNTWHPDPTEQQFYWNVNTCLAMGAKGIQYYPLVQPNGSFENGLILADGTPTRYHGYAANINKQIACVDEVLMNATHKGIIVVGNKAMSQTNGVDCRLSGTSFRELRSVTGTADVMVGCFEYNGKTALYVVNYSFEKTNTVTLNFENAVALTKYTTATENLKASASHTISLPAGAGALIVVG